MNKILKNIHDQDHNEKENKQTTLNQGTGVQCHNDSFMLLIKKIFPYKEIIYSVGNGVNVFKVICVTIKMH